MAIASELVERTMHLSAKDRAELARRLILSLESGTMQEDVERAWEAEIERRISAYERGEVGAVEWRVAVKRAKSAIRKNRK
jgi:putative addiction module component (TIGR02574 family)